jgi:hypothetical protein
MRTAVVRINVDPRGQLSEMELSAGLTALAAAEIDVVDPGGKREVQFLMAGDDVAALTKNAVEICGRIFGTEPAPGVVTFVSRGTDDDALGVLAGFGLTGEVSRQPGTDGYDVVEVRLPRAALDRVPESRIQTALEASLNEEVVIIPV